MRSVYSNGYTCIEVVHGGVNNRGQIFQAHGSNLLFDAYDVYDSVVTNAFHSVYMHLPQLAEYAEERHGSIAGYDGTVGIDYFYWDFDHTNVDIAKDNAAELIDRLLALGYTANDISLFYSGNKGFHVLLYSSDIISYCGLPNLPLLVKGICVQLAKDLESFDNKIYDATRLFRTTNSQHGKTKLFKVPLIIDAIFQDSMDDIKNLAMYQQPFNRNGDKTFSDNYNSKMQELLYDLKTQKHGKVASSMFNASQILEGIQSGFKKGNRNSGLTSVAGMLHRRNISSPFISAILHAINNQSPNPLLSYQVDTIVNSVGRYPIDPTYLEPLESDIITFKDALEYYKELRVRVDKMKYGFPHLDEQLPFFDPGDVLLICARAGVGKTTLGMQLNNNIAHHCGGYGLFVSLEMAKHFLFLRAACIEANKHSSEKFSTFDVSNMILSESAFASRVHEAWKNLLILDKDNLSLEQIEQYYILAKEKHPNLSNLLIDYGGLIRGGDDYEGISRIARALKGLSKRLETRTTVTVQLSRKAGDGTIPVKMDHLRDTGAWEEGADYIYGCWLGQPDPTRIHVRALKNRWLEGREHRFDLINRGLYYLSDEYKADPNPVEMNMAW